MARPSDPNRMKEEPGLEADACRQAGSHDYTEPIIVRQGAHVFNGSVEAAVIFCRRCGAQQVGGWGLRG